MLTVCSFLRRSCSSIFLPCICSASVLSSPPVPCLFVSPFFLCLKQLTVSLFFLGRSNVCFFSLYSSSPVSAGSSSPSPSRELRLYKPSRPDNFQRTRSFHEPVMNGSISFLFFSVHSSCLCLSCHSPDCQSSPNCDRRPLKLTMEASESLYLGLQHPKVTHVFLEFSCNFLNFGYVLLRLIAKLIFS